GLRGRADDVRAEPDPGVAAAAGGRPPRPGPGGRVRGPLGAPAGVGPDGHGPGARDERVARVPLPIPVRPAPGSLAPGAGPPGRQHEADVGDVYPLLSHTT